ncbi:GtrA-like protein [Aminobacter sp. MSH1]|uniref:GtrA family protein n=1 Tax=Aminobacter sp. MSH1 TaxID=374606 RepID=UPI000D3AB359|nr:GtrA family protein [Aminobacter sp. MSH1]AWC21347.1 GtrA-like protein [Aminobacter sp. MSH1]
MSTRSKPLFELQRVLRYGAVGLLNTALGFGIILALLKLGFGDFMANVTGFAAGLLLSFVLNSLWTFDRTAGYQPGVVWRYAISFAIAYAANLAVVMAARAGGIVDNPLTHLAGIGVYSITFYLGSAHFVFVPRSGLQSKERRDYTLSTERWPEAAILLGLLAAYLMLRNIAVSLDVVWQMWIARQMLGGAVLYRDILELNPPLWFWMAIPVEWTAQALDIPSVQAIVAAVFLLIAAALALLSILLTDTSPATRATLLVTAFLALVIIPIQEFAQREHLAAIGAIPYLALIARRADNLPTDWKVAAATGLLAASGFALKHYFVLVPLLLELWLIYRLRRNWTPVRAETVILSAGAASYGVAVVLLAPDFLTTMVPMVSIAYDGYEVSFLKQFLRPFIAVWALSGIVLWQQRSTLPSLTFASALAALAFSFAYFAQQKGWRYHSVPTTALLFFAVAPLWQKHRWRSVTLPANAALVVCTLLPLIVSLAAGPYKNVTEATVRDLLRDSRPGTATMMLTAHPTNFWPTVEKAGLKWPSRYFAFWMVLAMSEHEKKYGSLTPELAALANDIRRQTVEDLRCNVPDIILVDDFRLSKSPGFDILEFFRKDKDFERLFANYSLDRKSVIYTSYKKAADWQPERPVGCRTIH